MDDDDDSYSYVMLLTESFKEAVDRSDHETAQDILTDHWEFFTRPNHYFPMRYTLLKARNCDDDTIELYLQFFQEHSDSDNPQIKLKIALLEDDFGKVESLLKSGARLDGDEWDGNSPAIYALSKWKAESNVRAGMLKLLVANGLNVNFRDAHGGNLLHQFVHYYVAKEDSDAIEVAEILLSSVVDRTELSSTLRHVIVARHPELLSYLIDKGADVDHQCEVSKSSPLCIAARFNDENIIEILLSKGADVNAQNPWGWTPLTSACFSGCDRAIEVLLRNGADVNVRSFDGISAYDALLRSQNARYERALIVVIKELARLFFEDPELVPDVELVNGNPRAREHFRNCRGELSLMANTRFYEAHTYYSVLSKVFCVRRLTNFVKKEKNLRKFERDLPRFGYYERDLRRILDEAIREKEKFMAIVARLKLAFGKKFPNQVIEIMAENLTIDDVPV